MQPTLHTGDRVFILPTKANEIQPGEIAAFETPEGLVTHRIVRRRQTGARTQLLEMSDVDLAASWIEEQALVGRVALIHHGSQQADLQHPMAKKSGAVTAYLRYALFQWYIKQKSSLLRVILHKCSRLPVRIGYQFICRSSASQSLESEETLNVAKE